MSEPRTREIALPPVAHAHMAAGYPYARHCPNCQAIERYAIAADRELLRGQVAALTFSIGISFLDQELLQENFRRAVLALIESPPPRRGQP